MIDMQSRKCQINVRASEKEYAAIKAQAQEAKLTISDFLRKSALQVKINHVNNGDEIVKEMRSFHNDMLTYHNKMTKDLQSLKKAIEDNSNLLREHPMSNTEEFKATYKLQRHRINTLIDVIAYQNEVKENEISACVDCILNCFGK